MIQHVYNFENEYFVFTSKKTISSEVSERKRKAKQSKNNINNWKISGKENQQGSGGNGKREPQHKIIQKIRIEFLAF